MVLTCVLYFVCVVSVQVVNSSLCIYPSSILYLLKLLSIANFMQLRAKTFIISTDKNFDYRNLHVKLYYIFIFKYILCIFVCVKCINRDNQNLIWCLKYTIYDINLFKTVWLIATYFIKYGEHICRTTFFVMQTSRLHVHYVMFFMLCNDQ